MNDTWADVVVRSEFVELYDYEPTDQEWSRLTDDLDDAVADVLAEFHSVIKHRQEMAE